MSRDAWTRLAVLALLVLAGVWLVRSTEWVEAETETPPRKEAATNRFFAAEHWLRALRIPVERHTGMDRMPPAAARLVLTSAHWDLFPGRAQRLRHWVEAGGHLVLPATMADDKPVADWIPVTLSDRRRQAPRSAASVASAPRPTRAAPLAERNCRSVTESVLIRGAPPPPSTELRLCASGFWRQLEASPGTAPLWVVQGSEGIELLRVPVGAGSVTVIGPYGLLHNHELLRADNPLVVAAALQLDRAAAVWLVTEEARPSLLAWVWRHGWVAVLLALAAGAAWLWRDAVRFGPVGSMALPQRRSMHEQVAGTARFLQRHGPAALHAAQVRALHEAAQRRLPGYTRMSGPARIDAIVRATRLDGATLARALQPGPRKPHLLPAELELLETARRRLVPPFHPAAT